MSQNILCHFFVEFQNFCVYQIFFIAIGNSRTSRRNSIAKKLHKSKLKSLYTISPFFKVSNSSVHEQYLARKCFPFLQWQCPPLKQMHLSKQFFLTNLHIEVLLLSAKTTNGSVFVFYYTSFRGVIFSLAKKKSVANALVAFGLFFIVFIFCKLCGWGKNIFAKVRPIFTVRKGGSF